MSAVTVSQDSNFTVNNEYSDFVVKQGALACEIDGTAYYIRSSGYTEPSAIYKKEKGSDKEECIYTCDEYIYSIMPEDFTHLMIGIHEIIPYELTYMKFMSLDLATGVTSECPFFAGKYCTLPKFFDNHIAYYLQDFDRQMMEQMDLYVFYNNSENILIDSKVINYAITPERIIYQKYDELQLISCNYDGTDKKVIVKYGDGIDEIYIKNEIPNFYSYNNMLYIMTSENAKIFNLKDMSVKVINQKMDDVYISYYDKSRNMLYDGYKEINEYDLELNKVRNILTVTGEHDSINRFCVIDNILYYEVEWCEGSEVKFELRTVKL